MRDLFRKYKLAYQFFNFFKKSELAHNVPLYKKYGINKKYYSSISNLDFKSIASPKNIYDAKNSAVELPKNTNFNLLDDKTKKSLLQWSTNGFAVLNQFFSETEIDAFNNEVELLIDKNQVDWRNNNKIMFAIHQSPLLYNAGTNTKLLDVLNLLMGKEVDLFQSINFITGSQQRTHSDFIHMSTFPYGNLIAVWIALEDIHPDSGPIHYYPGSHKLPYIFNEDYDNVGTKYKLGNKPYAAYEDKIDEIIKQNNLKKEIFLPKKGDLLIWHANLLHGGEPVNNNKLTRKSMVFHYYTNDAICFHERTQRPTLKK